MLSGVGALCSTAVGETSNTAATEKAAVPVLKGFAKKYHTAALFDRICAIGRVRNDSKNGYYHKGELVRILGKNDDGKNMIIYTTGSGVNYLSEMNLELLPMDYEPAAGERFNDMPVLPAEQVMEETTIWLYKEDYGLPCYRPADEYENDYGNSLTVRYGKEQIRKYGRLKRTLSVYTSRSDCMEKTTIPKGAYVGILSYRYGERYGAFEIYNNGTIYTIPEWIDDNTSAPSLEVMSSDFVPSAADEVYGMDDSTMLRNYALLQHTEKSDSEPIFSVSPLSPLYFYFDDNPLCRYNITPDEKLSGFSISDDIYTLSYQGHMIRAKSSLFKMS